MLNQGVGLQLWRGEGRAGPALSPMILQCLINSRDSSDKCLVMMLLRRATQEMS